MYIEVPSQHPRNDLNYLSIHVRIDCAVQPESEANEKAAGTDSNQQAQELQKDPLVRELEKLLKKHSSSSNNSPRGGPSSIQYSFELTKAY